LNLIYLKKKILIQKNLIELKMTSNVLSKTLNSSKENLEFGWNRTWVPTLASLQR